MIVQERLAGNCDAVKKFQKSIWGYLRMGEKSRLIILFWYSQKLMRIYCIEKNLRSIIIYISVPFFSITYCDQNRRANDKPSNK